MDNTDAELCLILLQNSRTSYSDIAEKFGLSVNSVHKRIQNLVKSNIIRKFRTNVSEIYLKLNRVIFWGISGATNLEQIIERLGSHENIYWVSQGGGNFLLVGSYLRNIYELDSVMNFVKNEGNFDDLQMGIVHSPLQLIEKSSNSSPNSNSIQNPNSNPYILDKIDMQILENIKDNSRKSVSDIASELNITPKTITKHLNTMIENNCIEFTVDWYPDQSGDIISLHELKVPGGKKTFDLIGKCYQQYHPNFLAHFTFMNNPDLILGMFWVDTIEKLRNLEKEIKKEFGLLKTYILYFGKIYESWRDRYLKEKLSEFQQQK